MKVEEGGGGREEEEEEEAEEEEEEATWANDETDSTLPRGDSYTLFRYRVLQINAFDDQRV